MSSTTRISVETATLQLQAHIDNIDLGASAGKVEIRTGTQPSAADDPATGTLLCTIDLAEPAFGAITQVGDQVQASANGLPLSGTNALGGVATWFRVYQGDGTPHSDGSVGLSDSGADMVLSDTTLVQGEITNITQWEVAHPLSGAAGASNPGGANGSIQYNATGTLGGFGSYNSTDASVQMPGALGVQAGAGFGSTSLVGLMLGMNGAGASGVLVLGLRDNVANEPFTVMSVWESGNTDIKRNVNLGGGGFGSPDANSVSIYTSEDLTDTPNAGLRRLHVEPRGFVSIGMQTNTANAWLEVRADSAQTAAAIRARQYAGMTVPVLEVAHSDGNCFFEVDAIAELKPTWRLNDVVNLVTLECECSANGVQLRTMQNQPIDIMVNGISRLKADGSGVLINADGTQRRVNVGAADSGGSGQRALTVDN